MRANSSANIWKTVGAVSVKCSSLKVLLGTVNPTGTENSRSCECEMFKSQSPRRFRTVVCVNPTGIEKAPK